MREGEKRRYEGEKALQNENCEQVKKMPKADEVVELIRSICDLATGVSGFTAKKMERLQIVETSPKATMEEKLYEVGRDTLMWSPLFDEMREPLMIIRNCLLKIEDNVKRAEV